MRGAEVHKGLVVKPWGVLVEQSLREGGKLFLARRGIYWRGDAEVARQHAVGIAVHGGAGQIVGKRTNGGGGIVANANQSAHVFIVIGKASLPLLHDLAGGAVHVAGTAVIAQSLPQFQHLCLIGGGERGHVGEARYETLIVCPSLRHLRLLQNNFRNPNLIRVGNAAPRQFALVRGIPMLYRVLPKTGFGVHFNGEA